MSGRPFVIETFAVPCQHIREYPRENIDGDQAPLFLSVKRYTRSEGYGIVGRPVTVLAAGGNGFSKELYEPLWEDLASCSLDHGLHIKSILIADMAHQGQSAVMNQDRTGNDPSWFDVARDLLQLVNYFRSEMLGHVIAVGHSIGATALINLAAFHPRLFSQLILIEPIVGDCTQEGIFYAYHAMKKPCQWPSPEKAAEYARNNSPFKNWDERVVHSWLNYGIMLCSNSGETVRLVTDREREARTYVRLIKELDESCRSQTTKPPDYLSSVDRERRFYCPGATVTLASRLAEVRVPIYYIFGENSVMSPEAKRTALLNTSRVQFNGSEDGKRVGKSILPGVGHLAPFEDPKTCSQLLARAMLQSVEDEFLNEVPSSSQVFGKNMSEIWRTALEKEMAKLKKEKLGKL